jgi:rod shape determining protein RodA
MGWFNIYAAVYNEEHQSIFDLSQRYGMQMLWILASLVIIMCVFAVDVKFYSFFAYAIYGFMIFMLVAVLLFGKEINGAKAWFAIGRFQIQPAEFAKVAVALALAKYLSTFNIRVMEARTLVYSALMIALPSLLILIQPDTGSMLVFAAFVLVLYREGMSGGVLLLGVLVALLFVFILVFDRIAVIHGLIIAAFVGFYILNKNLRNFFIALGVFWGFYACIWGFEVLIRQKEFNEYFHVIIALALSSVAYIVFLLIHKIRNAWIVLALLSLCIGFTFSVDYVFHNVMSLHQQQRINILLGIEDDPLGFGYNVNQSKIAIGSGGFSGKGFLQGTQTKFNFVPEQSTDFIFCTVGEEWGFVGSFVVIALFGFLILRIIFLSERQRSVFSRIYGYGVASVFFFHVLINIGMTIGLLPVIGIPLPFFSYGGSSLWAFTIMLFVLIRLDASRLELFR